MFRRRRRALRAKVLARDAHDSIMSVRNHSGGMGEEMIQDVLADRIRFPALLDLIIAIRKRASSELGGVRNSHSCTNKLPMKRRLRGDVGASSRSGDESDVIALFSSHLPCILCSGSPSKKIVVPSRFGTLWS